MTHIRSTPDWRVTAVFDPDGTGQDFAYTVGLARHGVPELHAWARPTDGTDPGDGFCLSSADLCCVLNDWARRLIAGEVQTGSVRRDVMDLGLAHARWELGAPVLPADVDAYVLGEHQPVLPLRWSLVRPEPTEFIVDEAAVGDRVRWLRSHAVGGAPPAGAADAFGPWTPAIQVLQVVVRRADPLRCLTAVLGSHLARYAGPLASAAARWSGRLDAVEAARGAAGEDAAIVAARLQGGGDPASLQRRLAHLLAAAYGCWVVADLLGLHGGPLARLEDELEAEGGADMPAERARLARMMTTTVDALVLPDWSSRAILAQPAARARLARVAPGDAAALARISRDLGQRSHELSWEVTLAVAAAGFGWLDDERAVRALQPRSLVPTQRDWDAAAALSALVAAEVALDTSLAGLDLGRVRRLVRRLRPQPRKDRGAA